MDNQSPDFEFDPNYFLEKLGGDKEQFRELINIFIDGYPKHLEKLKQALQEKKTKEFEREAHSLKGELLSFGYKPAVEIALKLEMMGKQGNLDMALFMILELDSYVNKIIKSLKSIADQDP